MVTFSLENVGTNKFSFAIFIFGIIIFTIGLNPEFMGLQSRFALFAQEMLRYGPTWFPTIYRTPYPDYPATSTYLIYLLSLPFKKVTVLSATLPTAVVSALILVVIYRIGALQSPKLGICAVLLALFTHEFLKESRSVELDQYTSLVTVLCFYIAYSANILGRYKRLWLIPLLFIVGFSFRGPIGLVIPAAVTFGFYLWEKQYKKCFVFGLVALSLFGFCLVLLLAAAYQQGQGDLVDKVLQAQGVSRTGYYTNNHFYYVAKAFTSYDISFPLAVIVSVASCKKIFKRETPDARLLGHLVFWVVIILVGMSIPGAKKTRYILPVVPALSLIASYMFVHPSLEGFMSEARKAFLWSCRMLPFITGIGALVLCLPTSYFTLISVFPGLVVMGILIALIVVYPRWNQKFRRYSKNDLVNILTAVLSFIAFNVWFINPLVYSHEHTKPFIEKLESLLPSSSVTIAFYQIGPDAEDIKLVANMNKPIAPIFIKNAEDLIQQPLQTYFIAKEGDFSNLPDNVAQKMQVQFRGQIGHKDCLVFSQRLDSSEPDSSSISTATYLQENERMSIVGT